MQKTDITGYHNELKEFEEYLIRKERSKNTILSYTQSVKCYYKYYDNINKTNMISFKNMLLSSHKPATVTLRCNGLNEYFRFLGREDCTVSGVAVHNSSSIENVITMEEYLYFLDCLKSNHNDKLYWMLRYMASTGCRVSELVSLKKYCLNTGEYALWTKGKMRKLLIPNRLIKESASYFKGVDSEYLFPNRYGDKMQTGGVSSQIARYGHQYGIRREVLHPHAFRHFFAIQFLKNNNNLSLLSDLLGHSSIKTTAIYLRLSSEEQKNILNETINW